MSNTKKKKKLKIDTFSATHKNTVGVGRIFPKLSGSHSTSMPFDLSVNLGACHCIWQTCRPHVWLFAVPSLWPRFSVAKKKDEHFEWATPKSSWLI